MSDESDAGPHHKRKRKTRRLEESSPSSSSSNDSSPITGPSRRKTSTRNPIRDSTDSDTDSESGSSCIAVVRKKKRVARVSSDSDSDSSGSPIIEIKKRTARLRSDSPSDSDASDRGFQSTSATSQWETDYSDSESKNAVPKPVQDNAIDSDSSDGQSDKCPICLISFKNQEIGTPESCDHMFCLECIQEWSKNMNTCPVDRQEYNIILVRRKINGKIVDRIQIQKPVPQNEVNIIEDPTFCEICGSSEQEDRMLLCDGCDLGFHLFCLTPPLDDVPVGSWFCNDCSPDDIVDSEITMFEIQLLLDDAHSMDDAPFTIGRRRNSPRLVPRTRHTERVRSQIATNRLNQARVEPSASSRIEDSLQERVTSTTSRTRSRRKRRRKYVYKIDEVTGERVLVKKKKKKKRRERVVQKPKTVKKRLAVQLGICAPKSVPQNLPDVRVPQPVSSIGLMRQQAGIPALHLFGRNDDLDYFSEDGDYDGGDILMRRAPNHSDIAAMRRAARRKTIHIPSAVSSTNDILGSILDSQERFHSRNTMFSVDENGKFKMEPKNNNNYIKVNQEKGLVRQRPTSYNNTSSTSNDYVPDAEPSADYNNRTYEQHSTPTSTMESTSGANTSRGGNEQDAPQDYSQRTLCASYDPPEQEKPSRSNSPHTESDIDIYSDIETVSTSKVDEADLEFKPSSPQNSSQRSEDENDSDTDMVIDTEKNEEYNKEETKVTSTVDSNSEAAPDMAPTYSNSGSEIQSEAIQSTNQIGENKSDYNEKDDDEDSEDGCPNFSIYSRESINLAKDSDITLPSENNQVGEVSSSPSYDPEKPTDDADEEIPPEPDDLDDLNEEPQQSQDNNVIKPSTGGLYSDSEDESVVRKENSSFAISDIRNMTEDISEEERSYTPCLDEKVREGIEGLDTEMISDEDRNDFDESHEHKTVSDGGDALEINAKESELDFTRPEDYEEGEIVDKSKKKAEAEAENKEVEDEGKKKKKEKVVADKDSNKENEVNKEASFKKLSKSNKDRNYRDKDRSKSRDNVKKKDDRVEKEKAKEREKDKRERKREKRKELERYDVRALIAEKPKRDQFGRDIRQSPSRSRSRSFTPPPRRSLSRSRKSPSRRRSPAPRKPRGRSRTRKNLSRSRSPRRRSRSKTKKTKKRSISRPRKTRKSRDRSKAKKKARSLTRSKSPRRKRNWNRRRSKDWTPSFSRSPTPEQVNVSPSWTPPRLMDKNQANKQHNLKVILANDAGKKKKEKKKKVEKRKEAERQRKRRHERTPPPSKEVFASGDNILVSVSFNKENETRDVTTRDKRRKSGDEPPKKKKKRNKNKKDTSGLKPVAIIDLERSPFKELTPSPKDVIVLTDSENGEESIQKNICDSSQQVASPERIVNSYAMGPKTPPEPQIKFSLNAKQPTVRAISNPLHEADDMEVQNHQENISDSLHKGPNTPPEPPNSPPSSPDAYDPFEPTKSRSPTPEPMQNQQKDDVYDSTISDGRQDDKQQTPDALKSLTPPVADIQPADSQSSIHATPDTKSPERIGVVINQQIQPISSTGSKPVAQTTPFSSVPTSLINAAPITNLTAPRINILNSTVVQPSSIPQRIVLPNIQKSSPVKIAPTKSIKPMPSKNVNKTGRKSRQNGTELLDLDSPYSPGSSDYEDLFEPPPESMAKSKKGKSGKNKNTFDALFGSPSYNAKKKNDKVKKVQVSPTKVSGTKTVGVKLDEDNLKILDELPNSAVEMQVKDKYLKKLNRQERVVEEVKMVLKPHYNKKKINKEEYKDILRRSVPKICHNKTGEINPTKIKNLIEAYVKKIRHSKKVTSSSSVNPQKV